MGDDDYYYGLWAMAYDYEYGRRNEEATGTLLLLSVD